MSFIDWDDVYDPREISATGALRRVNIASDLLPKLNRWGGWYGHRAAAGLVRVAWVGEQLAPTDDPYWPPLFWGRTGSFLLRAIKEQRHVCYFTNAHKPHWADPDLKEELYGHVLPDLVVALGRKSHDTLRQHGVSATFEPHPSWVMRFKQKNIAEYQAHYRQLVEKQKGNP